MLTETLAVFADLTKSERLLLQPGATLTSEGGDMLIEGLEPDLLPARHRRDAEEAMERGVEKFLVIAAP